LEKTFSLIEPYIAYDSSKFDLIKKNLINWSGQNQEHHAFDEFSYNFVHSKSSAEVSVIFDAIRMFECQLFPESKKIACDAILAELTARVAQGHKVLSDMLQAPNEAQQRARLKLMSLQNSLAQTQSEIDFIAACQLARAGFLPPGQP
jgi:DNA sulfur modification protein DndD